jgi:GT2 family glycosyltransferase
MIDLSIVIVTYNSERVISSCLSSIMNHKTDLTYEVIVVDNSSTDKTKQIVSQYTSVQLINSSKNVGFSKANNIGIREANGKYIMILNPDVLLTDYCLDSLVVSLEECTSRSMVAPKLIYPSGEVQESVRRFPNLVVQLLGRIPLLRYIVKKEHKKYLMSNWDHNQSTNVDWVIGAAMLSTSSYLKEIGMFDEDFFLYFEDLDLCYRFYKKGYKVFYNSEVSVYHEYQRSSTRKVNKLTFIHVSSLIKFYRKHSELIFPSRR